jgi:hypothetical protein
VVDVEDFRGGKFGTGGVVFQGQIQDLYWQAIERCLIKETHAAFQKWEEQTASYPSAIRRASLEGTGTLLRQFVASTIARALDTDRRLRGQGYPDKVQVRDTSAQHSRANAEIVRLVEAHRGLLEGAEPKAQFWSFQQVNEFGTRNRGTLTVVAIVIAIVGGVVGLLKYFAG